MNKQVEDDMAKVLHGAELLRKWYASAKKANRADTVSEIREVMVAYRMLTRWALGSEGEIKVEDE